MANKNSGFTLIELVTAMAVLSILVTLAVPSFRSLTLNGRRAAAVNELVVSLMHARSVAITQRRPVVVCRTANSGAETPECNTGTGWESGWVSFVDADADNSYDSGEEILRRHEALPGGISAHGNGDASTHISFNSTGIAGANSKISYCDSRGWGDDSRILSVSMGGRVQTLLAGQDAEPALTACL